MTAERYEDNVNMVKPLVYRLLQTVRWTEPISFFSNRCKRCLPLSLVGFILHAQAFVLLNKSAELAYIISNVDIFASELLPDHICECAPPTFAASSTRD
jgi:hypothetical protein